jgi:hypothetical protein
VNIEYFICGDAWGVEQAETGNGLGPPTASGADACHRTGRHPSSQLADERVASGVTQIDARKFMFDVGGHEQNSATEHRPLARSRGNDSAP